MITATRAETSWGRFRADFQAELLARIPEHLGRLSWSAERIEAAQRDGLRRLLTHAVARSPFHRQRLAGADVTSIEPAGLASLPVMTKTDMMAAIDDVFTDRRLSLGAVEQALGDTGSEPVPVLGRYVALATGGSTGQRGVFVFDPAAKAKFILSIIRPLLAQLYAAGGIPPGGLPMAMVGAGSAVPRHRRRRRRDGRHRLAAPCHVGPRHLAVAADSGPPQRPPDSLPGRVCLGAGPPCC